MDVIIGRMAENLTKEYPQTLDDNFDFVFNEVSDGDTDTALCAPCPDAGISLFESVYDPGGGLAEGVLAERQHDAVAEAVVFDVPLHFNIRNAAQRLDDSSWHIQGIGRGKLRSHRVPQRPIWNYSQTQEEA